jgi:radical SAM protein with 4Fe4S-binding SPASM domain
VSWDGTEDARLDRAGRATDQRVIANLRRIVASGIPCGVTLVLGAHNHRILPSVYDRLESLGVAWLNVVPLFLANAPIGVDRLALSLDETGAALISLFEHWVNRGRRLPVQPIVDCVWTVHDRRARRRTLPKGEVRFVVRPNGDLSVQSGIASEAVAIGNLFDRSIQGILASERYAAELARADRLRERHCTTCRYKFACDARPILRYPHDYASGPCPVESHLCDYIVSFLSRTGSTEAELLGWSSVDLPFALRPRIDSSPTPQRGWF